jgi:hypothetical protein
VVPDGGASIDKADSATSPAEHPTATRTAPATQQGPTRGAAQAAVPSHPWNYADFGADDVVDFDAAVRSPGDSSKLNATYLTNGMLNDTYHDKIAQTMAEACADVPPRIEL